MFRRWFTYCCQFTSHFPALCFTRITPTDAECFSWRLDLSQIIWPTWQWTAGSDSLMSHLCRLYCQSFCAPYTHGCLGKNSDINYAESKIIDMQKKICCSLLFSVDTPNGLCPVGCFRSGLFAVLMLYVFKGVTYISILSWGCQCPSEMSGAGKEPVIEAPPWEQMVRSWDTNELSENIFSKVPWSIL